MMMKHLIAGALMLLIVRPALAASEICYEGASPVDATPYAGLNPFTGMKLALVITAMRRSCGHSIHADGAYFQSMVMHFGCQETPIAATLANELAGQSSLGQSMSDIIQQEPQKAARICELLGKCTFPEAYSRGGPTPQCPLALDNLL